MHWPPAIREQSFPSLSSVAMLLQLMIGRGIAPREIKDVSEIRIDGYKQGARRAGR